MKNDSNIKQTKPENEPQKLYLALSETLEIGFEFLLVYDNGAQVSLKREEIEPAYRDGKAFLECIAAEGVKRLRIISAEKKERGIRLETANESGADTGTIELIPRITAAELLAALKESRLEIAERIAAVAAAKIPNSKISGIRLSKGIRAGEYGNSAQVRLQISPREQIAVFAQVTSGGGDPEAFLVSALSWFSGVSQHGKKTRVEKLWLAAGKKKLGKLKRIIALLKPKWRAAISLFEIDLENSALREVKIPEFHRLWREKPRKLNLPAETSLSETAHEIISLAPDEIDAARFRHGTNLRFNGLPFARIRNLPGGEKMWFGSERKRRAFDDAAREDFLLFVEELKRRRNARAENKDNYLYRRSPEHWLESILRRDITQLDAGLILSPIYHQFRASAEQIDLLALRRDGRLAVIELKVTPSREMIFQAADYWRQIELQRRSGSLAKARAFGDLKIADEPALVYLVAPALSFHRDLEFWAGTVSPKIEIYRYDLHENWREKIKVLQRVRIS